LGQVVLVIQQIVTITCFVAIPRRKVNSKADAGILGGGGELGDDVAVPVFPVAGTHGIVGVIRGPQAEPIVVFCSEEYCRKARIFGDLYPLRCVELGGVEDGGVSVAGTPLGVREGVGAEVEEEGHVAQLPLELERRWEGQNGKRWGFPGTRCRDQEMTETQKKNLNWEIG